MQQSSPEVNEILEQENSPLPFYEELLTISWAELDHRQKEELLEKGEDLSQKVIHKT